MTDPIADMLTRIRNAVTARHARVEMPASKLKAEIARILQDEGYISGFKMVETPAERTGKAPRQQMRMFLKYGPGGEKAISGISRVSRPGRRVYTGTGEVPSVLGGLGVTILTTSRGVMTGRAAKQAGVGGEILCNVW
ncbi:MAG: 30S ribosomal protein S8 [Acidobacterium sp.]|jgi:small subunit ribosomal protein S8|nr:30S ribosomal protein S8 [Acidobacteriota bacterium]PHY12018.1 MAG: 30S ribosomal protein S8 [Acidobacterium sp.]